MRSGVGSWIAAPLLALQALQASLSQGAAAATTGGHAGLALAALVAEYSPGLSAPQKRVMRQLLAGGRGASPFGRPIAVAADAIVCRASNVDIAARSCTLAFAAKTIAIDGRRANELFATMIEAGVPSGVATGWEYESLTRLACIVDPRQISQPDGAGAKCEFGDGP